jgi:hypothetical protein
MSVTSKFLTIILSQVEFESLIRHVLHLPNEAPGIEISSLTDQICPAGPIFFSEASYTTNLKQNYYPAIQDHSEMLNTCKLSTFFFELPDH